jgi:phage/plasmid-associated DNA primase
MDDRLLYLEQIIYYIFFRCYGRNFIFHLYGKGGTGKTTFTNFLASLVGIEAVTTTTPEKIAQEIFQVANFKDKTLLLILDKKGKSFNMEKLKSLSGGDIFAAELKYKQKKDIFIPQPVFFFSTNGFIRSYKATL